MKSKNYLLNCLIIFFFSYSCSAPTKKAAQNETGPSAQRKITQQEENLIIPPQPPAYTSGPEYIAVDPNGVKPNAKWIMLNNFSWKKTSDTDTNSVEVANQRRSEIDELENNRGECPLGMVEVEGRMLMNPGKNPTGNESIEHQQHLTCTRWNGPIRPGDKEGRPARCEVFNEDALKKRMEKIKDRQEMKFCIDRYEFPNIKDEFPMTRITYLDAEKLCKNQNKRLCTEDEWTFACEGEEGLPYPYGYVRSPDKCNIDKTWTLYNETNLGMNATPQKVANELHRLWQGNKSGTNPECKSPFGVYDMTGNIDEWTSSTRPNSSVKHKKGQGNLMSILKGGYWGPVRTRCRPSTRSHDAVHSFYQQGVRCCSDIPKY